MIHFLVKDDGGGIYSEQHGLLAGTPVDAGYEIVRIAQICYATCIAISNCKRDVPEFGVIKIPIGIWNYESITGSYERKN